MRTASRLGSEAVADVPVPTATLVSEYSAPVSGSPYHPTGVGLPKWCRIDRKWSGIELTWSTDGVYPEIRIVRKRDDYPYKVEDGLTVYQGDAYVGTFSDVDAKGPGVFYYSLWFRETPAFDWVTEYWLRVWQVALGENTWTDFLWKLLPSVYRQSETPRDEARDLNNFVTTLLAPVFRETEDLIGFIPKLLDVDETAGPFLAAIAQYVGLDPNYDLTFAQQREEIKSAIATYQSKGLKSTVITMATAILGVECSVVDWVDDIFIANRVGKNTLEIDEAKWSRHGLDDDHTAYCLDFTLEAEYNTVSYGILAFPRIDQEIPMRTVSKLYRVIPKFHPVYSHMMFWIIDRDLIEEIPSTVEAWFDDDEYQDPFGPKALLATDLDWKATTLGHNAAELWPLDSWFDEIG